MKKPFIDHLVFRLLSPLISGFIVYILILLVNNNVGALQEQFLGTELYVCIGLSFLILESCRLCLMLLQRWQLIKSNVLRISLQLLLCLLLTLIWVSMGMTAYYNYTEGFSPAFSELLIFNSIYLSLSIVYISLYASQQLLARRNEKRLEDELKFTEELDRDYQQFKTGINFQLLMESLELILSTMFHNTDKANELIGRISAVYRYILSSANREPLPFYRELEVLEELIELFDHLPYRRISLQLVSRPQCLVVPGALLRIAEQIIRTTIVSELDKLNILLDESEEFILIQYQGQDKLTDPLLPEKLWDISQSYQVYSNLEIKIDQQEDFKVIYLPKLLNA